MFAVCDSFSQSGRKSAREKINLCMPQTVSPVPVFWFLAGWLRLARYKVLLDESGVKNYQRSEQKQTFTMISPP